MLVRAVQGTPCVACVAQQRTGDFSLSDFLCATPIRSAFETEPPVVFHARNSTFSMRMLGRNLSSLYSPLGRDALAFQKLQEKETE